MTSSSSSPPSPLPPILLGAYWSKRCPVLVQNAFDPTLERPAEVERPTDVQARIDAGIDYEVEIANELAAGLGANVLDIATLDLSGDSHIEATVAAMNEGRAVILGGRLPDDPNGERQGRPDLLVRSNDTAARYVPVDVKHHQALTVAKESVALVSTVAALAPLKRIQVTGISPRYRDDDAIQLAHYWRMLEACGRAATTSVGGILGTDLVDGSHVIVWQPLDERRYKTRSGSSSTGVALRSALDRHDYEHALRTRIAHAASLRDNDQEDSADLLTPTYTDECDSCPWLEHCREVAGEHDASFEVGRLGISEWEALRDAGIMTAGDVASLDLETVIGRQEQPQERTQLVLDGWLPRVRHIRGARGKLAKAIQTARLVEAGKTIEQVGAIPAVPRADVEIDLDIETDRNGRAYLWGMLITGAGYGTPQFEHCSDFAPLDADSEAKVGAAFWKRITELVAEAEGHGQTVRIYHYSNPEPAALKRLAREQHDAGLPSSEDAQAFIDTYFVDLLKPIRKAFFGGLGLGLKQVATADADFHWRDEEPGGAQSQVWLDQAHGDDATASAEARERILRYNEDDVRATLAVRGWLAALAAQETKRGHWVPATW